MRSVASIAAITLVGSVVYCPLSYPGAAGVIPNHTLKTKQKTNKVCSLPGILFSILFQTRNAPVFFHSVRVRVASFSVFLRVPLTAPQRPQWPVISVQEPSKPENVGPVTVP